MLNKVKYFIDDKNRKCALFKGNKYIQEKTGYYVIDNNWRKDLPNSYRLHRAIIEDNKEHSSYHGKNASILTKIKRSININKAINAATEWHKNSPDSSEVHSKASKKGWNNRPLYKHICIQCGKEFETKEKTCKYCSSQCKNDYKLGYSLLDIESIEYVGKEDVYNMEVEKYHNFAVNGGTIIHNCDSIRYFCNTIMVKRILGRA